MAVQAPYWGNAFSHDFRGSGRANALEELPAQIGATVLSGPHSDLTCIASGSATRKRAREDLTSAMDPLSPLLTSGGALSASYANGINGQQMQRLLESRGASTSGRNFATTVPNELHSQLISFTMEIDALIRVQNERIRVGIEEATKRHCRGFLASVGQQAERRLRVMDAQLEGERRRNVELEEKVRQLSAESQVWFDAARNSEAMATALRSTLDQALLSAAAVAAEDPAVEDARSCCYEGGDDADVSLAAEVAAGGVRGRQCRVCGEREGCVVLLPCRHLCLCKECEPEATTCPVCCSTKNAALEVFLC